MKTRPRFRWWKRAALLVLAVPLLLAGAVWCVRLPAELERPPEATPIIVDVRGRVLATPPGDEMRACEPLPLAALGRWLPAVTVALEDHRFYEHAGCDLHALAAALARNARAGRVISGSSTITQQLIKLASQRTRRSWRAKFYENLAALQLERRWSKARILEAYLNRSHYGNRRQGPAAAARAYFRKAPEHLTLPEAVYLAGLPQAPSRFNPWTHPDAARARYRRSVARLSVLGFLTPVQAARMTEPPTITPPQPAPRPAPHFTDALLRQHPHLPGGLVATTLDLDLQQMAQARLRSHLARLAHRSVHDGAVVILDARDGSVRAMVSATDYTHPRRGQLNGATLFRSAGSTLKPFLYAVALHERELTAATLLPDTPDAVRAEYIDYDPRNYDQRFWGPVRVREALANSLNVPAVVTLSRVGARRTFLAFEECGLKFARPFGDYGAGLILGNAEVRLLDITAAYTLFAGHGLAVEPRLLASAPIRHRAFISPQATAIVADILADNDARTKTFSATSPLAFDGFRIPAKTGTSSGFRDGWTIGVTAQHAVGVWVGNFDGSPMHEIAAIAGAAPVFHEIVAALLARGDTSVPPPTEPALASAAVCRLTGLRPTDASPGTVREWFLPATQPEAEASRHLQTIDGRTRLRLPAEYAVWCNSALNHLNAMVDDTAPLRVVNPAPQATFAIDPHLPRAQQALRLIACGDCGEPLVWRVDGEVIAPSANGCFWPLAPGRHTAEVRSATMHAVTEFSVNE